MKEVTARDAVRILNEALAASPRAVEDLVETRLGCTDELADHPTIQVQDDYPGCKVGMLGILNGIFGCDSDGQGYIAAAYKDGGGLDCFVISQDYKGEPESE